MCSQCKSLKAVNRPRPQPRQHVIIELSMLMVMTKPQTPGMPACMAHPGLSLAPLGSRTRCTDVNKENGRGLGVTVCSSEGRVTFYDPDEDGG